MTGDGAGAGTGTGRDGAGAGRDGAGRGDGTALPASVEAAWGLRERPSKGPKPGIGVDRIVSAAVDVAAAEGLGAVSMGRVAKELGVSTMSLYRYVAAKSDLYLLMQEVAVGPPPPPPPPGAEWRGAITAWAVAQRERLRGNPWVLQIPISGPPATPHSVAWWERGLVALESTGLDDGDRLSVIMLINGFVRHEAMVAVDLGLAVANSGGDPEAFMRRYVATLERLADPERHPSVTRLLRSGMFLEDDDPDYDFKFGLGRILDGVEELMRQRGVTAADQRPKGEREQGEREKEGRA
ncbi:TetR/AcrR family transcriptional regulator C-terminal domain-containing protein [Streptomyces sp. NPDC047315]|uniref:TetR/AcrR family transcriptional regulator n=1 Tax=Streptomyces sp. NPDC047315 TaxID=3155142 RepID=UPI0033E44D0E